MTRADNSLTRFGETLLRIAPFAPAVVTLAFGLLVLEHKRRYVLAAGEADRYHAGVDALSRTYFALKNVESHQRGYLVTGDPTFLTDYAVASERAEAEISNLQLAMRASAEPRAILAVQELANQRLAASAEVVQRYQEGDRDEAAASVADGEGRRAMRQFEAATSAMRLRVDELAAERVRALERRHQTTFWFIIAGTLIAGIAGSASAWVLSRYARHRAEDASNLEALNADLREKTIVLEQQKEDLEDQATELEGQALELELQAQELEETTRLLAHKEERFRSLVEHASDMIIVLDDAASITYTSPSVAIALGIDAETLLGRPLSSLTNADDHDATRECIAGVIQQRSADTPIEARFAKADGTWRLFAGSARNLLDHPAHGIVINCRDVTHERNVEAQLRQSQKMEAMGLLAGGVAHDFNNLLTSISGYANFAAESIPESHPARTDLREVLKASDLAASLTRQLLAFSRRQVSKPEVLDLNDVVNDSIGMLRRLIGPTVEMAVRLDDSLGTVLVDAGQIRQVIINLAVNGRDAMPEGGRLAIETNSVVVDSEHAERRGIAPGNYVMFSVTDTGEGIPPEIQERIFEPFFTTKEQGKGTGLGLSTSYGIVRQAGGFIWVYSEPGSGTTFKVYLPVASSDAAAKPSATHVAAVAPSSGAAVLVVEDDSAVRTFARRALERAGFTVLVAENGDAALDVLSQENTVRVVITDVIMPGMSGGVLGRMLEELYPSINVLYTSGFPRDEMPAKTGIPANVSYLEKPYSSADLARYATNLMKRGSVAA